MTRLEPALEQITITRDITDPTSCNVTSGPLVKFDLLSLRDPDPGEGDIVVRIPELQEYKEASGMGMEVSIPGIHDTKFPNPSCY